MFQSRILSVYCRFLSNTKKTIRSSLHFFWWGLVEGGHLFEAGRLLTFLAFRKGVYWSPGECLFVVGHLIK